MDEIGVFDKLNAIATPQFALTFGDNSEKAIKISEHKSWLQSIRHEHPSTAVNYNIGVYIRYFNQTKYENYLSYHKKQFADTIALCPNWTLVDFYVDEGATAPNMESAPEWGRLLTDAEEGKVDLILTQKVSNVSRKTYEVDFCARMLACLEKPVGIYFISEDLFTLASYYRDDMKNLSFFPTPDWQILPDDDHEAKLLLDSRRLLNG